MGEFIESPRWEICPAYGYISEPEYRVVITRRTSGVERRNRSWLRPLLKFTLTLGPRHENEIQEALEWFHVAGGQARGFRIQDRVDYSSARLMETATSPIDQPLVEIAESPGTYQLTKRYQVGIDEDSQPVYQDRPIYKPVSGTVTLSGAGSVDYATGVVTGASPGTTWGGQFDVPVRFESPTFPVEIQNQRIEAVSFALQELRMNGATG
jgi:uncharacterized protein (TIGR02217 family)